MKLQVVEQELYLKAHKKLSKQYRHLQNDIDNFLNFINSKEDLGIDNELHLLYIYDKSKLENLTEKEIDNLILQQIG
jgi:hypothetical protein